MAVRRVVIDDKRSTHPPLPREYTCAGCEGTGDGSSSTPPVGWHILYEVGSEGRKLCGYFCCVPCLGDWSGR